MVRRWTSIIRLNFFTNQLKISKHPLVFLNVRKNVRYKKWIYIYTRRRRKRISFRKRLANWMFYNQIFAFWTLDYRNKKAVFRYQYTHQMFQFNFTIFNFHLFRKPMHNDTDDYDITPYVISHKPTKIIKHFNLLAKFKMNNLIWSQKLIDKTCAFLLTISEEFNNAHLPIFFKYDKILYAYPLTIQPLTILFNNLCWSYFFNTLIELYKISCLLIFFKINFNSL